MSEIQGINSTLYWLHFCCRLMFYQVQAEGDKPQTNPGQNREASQSQTSASSPSAFQAIASAFRRTFTFSNHSSSSNTTVTMFVQSTFFSASAGDSPSNTSTWPVTISVWFTRRPKRDGHRKQRPMSEGAFNSSFLFSSMATSEASTEEKIADIRAAHRASVGADAWGAGQDLPSLLQQVSLKGCKNSGGVFADDMGSLPRRRVDLFSSLRVRKREMSASEGKDGEFQKEIRTILSNLRNKGLCHETAKILKIHSLMQIFSYLSFQSTESGGFVFKRRWRWKHDIQSEGWYRPFF